MVLVSVNRLTAGMTTAAPVGHPRRLKTRLVERDVELTDSLIRRIRELGVAHVWTKHPLVRDLDHIALSRVPTQRRGIYEAIKLGFNELQDRAITTEDYNHYTAIIGGLITELIGQGSSVAPLAERLFQEGDELTSHSANVAYVAVTVAMHLETYVTRQRGAHARGTHIQDLTHLGVGAILHDLGKLLGPEEFRGQHITCPDLHADYRRHVLDGYQMLHGRVNPLAGAAVLHHHQRWDGKGWPDMTEMTHGRHVGGLNGRKIHVFSRIIAAADVFDALTANDDNPPRPAIHALWQMQSPEFAAAFDPVVLNAFLRFLPPYPTGVMVTLSDGRPAVVMGINPTDPCRPMVRPVDNNADGSDLELAEEPDLFIQESQGLDVSKWNYKLRSPREDHAEAERDA